MNQLAEVKQTTAMANTVATPATLLQMAIEKDADMDKLEKLMDMQERWEAKEAKKAFTKAMSDFRSKCPTINKDRNVSFKSTNYNYATLAGTIEQIKDLMAQCGLSHSWRTDQDEKAIKITCLVTHEGGHTEKTTLQAGLHDDMRMNTIQRLASTVSYLERYTLFAILGLASAEMDNDGNGADMPPQDAPPSDKSGLDKMVKRVVVYIEKQNEAGFYNYLNKTTQGQQKQIFSNLPDKSNTKKKYRDMEKRAADIVNRYGNQIEEYAMRGDMLAVAELLEEIKPIKSVYQDVWNQLSDNCKAEISASIQE